MTPNAVGFVTRAEAGLRSPESVSRNITPQHGGLAVHWGGSGSAPAAHGDCLKRWKAWQDFHMSKGWADIAYSFGFCSHGYVFAGRGLGVRSGAQGTTFGNQNFYAACWVGGSQSTPTRLALEALLWLIQAVRNSGAGLAVRPHSWFKPTSCPGSDLRGFIGPYHDTELEDDMPTPEEIAAAVWNFQDWDPVRGDNTPENRTSQREKLRHIRSDVRLSRTKLASLLAGSASAGAIARELILQLGG